MSKSAKHIIVAIITILAIWALVETALKLEATGQSETESSVIAA